MARKCKVAQKGKRTCRIHTQPLSSTNYQFTSTILEEYTKAELQFWHKMTQTIMLDKEPNGEVHA